MRHTFGKANSVTHFIILARARSFFACKYHECMLELLLPSWRNFLSTYLQLLVSISGNSQNFPCARALSRAPRHLKKLFSRQVRTLNNSFQLKAHQGVQWCRNWSTSESMRTSHDQVVTQVVFPPMSDPYSFSHSSFSSTIPLSHLAR